MEDHQVVANLARLLRERGVAAHLAQPQHGGRELPQLAGRAADPVRPPFRDNHNHAAITIASGARFGRIAIATLIASPDASGRPRTASVSASA